MRNELLYISDEVRTALQEHRPVVALESTIISHGMPYPQNVETALAVERRVRERGAVPATIAILNGRLTAGCSHEEIDYLGRKGQQIIKCSRRDLPVVVSQRLDGATTVATTMIIAEKAGIQVFATGGIGGVHRGAETTMDISADLEELAHTPVMVVCAGPKAILDLPLTMEYLETQGVPVIGYQTDLLPAFYTRQSPCRVDYRLDTPKDIASAFVAQRQMGFNTGMLVTNPVPEVFAMPEQVINTAIETALREADERGIQGKAVTPFLLAEITRLTSGRSLETNIRLVMNNADLAARTATELTLLTK